MTKKWRAVAWLWGLLGLGWLGLSVWAGLGFRVWWLWLIMVAAGLACGRQMRMCLRRARMFDAQCGEPS